MISQTATQAEGQAQSKHLTAPGTPLHGLNLHAGTKHWIFGHAGKKTKKKHEIKPLSAERSEVILTFSQRKILSSLNHSPV